MFCHYVHRSGPIGDMTNAFLSFIVAVIIFFLSHITVTLTIPFPTTSKLGIAISGIRYSMS